MRIISMGSCFYTMMYVLIGGTGNPDRIASKIVTGIGFLDAGVIFRGENRIIGIATAATIWAVAAVGMGLGAGHYFASASASVLILVVLAILPFFENMIDQFNHSKVYSIQCDFLDGKRIQYEQLLKRHNLKFRLVKR